MVLVINRGHMKNRYYWTFLILWFVLVGLSACTPQTQVKYSTTPTPLPISSLLATPSISPTVQFTIIPTLTPLPFPSNTSTLTPTNIQATWTPLPTLSLEEARAYVVELLDTNLGCRLPCWWGITPGQTTWQAAKSFLDRFVLHIGIGGDNISFSAYVRVPLPYEVPYANELSQTYTIQEGIVEEIKVYNWDFATHYYLPEFLNTYGQPEEVWVRTYRQDHRGEPFELALFYPSQGILMNTPGGGGGGIEGNILRNCLRGMNWPFLYLWSPENQMTFIEAQRRYLSDPGEGYYLPLYDATGMTVEEFYENFRDPDTTTCLETPLDLWP
jgi:hypothetical protein